MKTVEFKDGLVIRECLGDGCFSIVDTDNPKITRNDIRFAVTSRNDEDEYTISMAMGRCLVSTLLNSDHILIMKQILKEMGEI